MSMLRLKTLYELEQEHGSIFVDDVLEQYPELHDKFGESIKNINNSGLNYIQIHESLKTEAPLILIGTKVSLPQTKNFGRSLNQFMNSENFIEGQDFLYYRGIGHEGIHLLSFNNNQKSTEYFSAKEILDAYHEFENRVTPLIKLLMSYKN